MKNGDDIYFTGRFKRLLKKQIKEKQKKNKRNKYQY